ncbi:MAG TPA: polysaccharide deacetylase, partial [Acidimicrobiaceae bacterium]|nr:polysaccharide deacetylase [Acidimicrobiaceae bacterium]
MKAVMYHYVRKVDLEFPYFRFLELGEFSKQLEFFGNQYGFVSKAEFMTCLSEGRSMPGVVLTFDDGF